MSLFTTTALAASLLAAGTKDNPVIAWNNLAASATLSTEFGAAAAGNPEANAVSGSTFDKWRGVPSVDEIALRATLAAATPADFIAVAAHNLAKIGAGIVPQTAGASRTNLITRSQDFSASWVSNQATMSPNVVDGPDGSLSGARIVETATTAPHYVANSVSVAYTSGTDYTISIFVRRSVGARHFGIALPSAVFGATVSVAFNLSSPAATIEVAGTATTAGIEAYSASASGATFYRCWVKSRATATASSTGVSFLISNSTSDGNPAYLGDGSSALVLWGAQVEQGALTSYVRTTTAAASSSWYDWAPWVIPATGGVVAWRFPEVSAATWRVLIRGVSPSVIPSIGVFFIGKAMILPQRFYQGFSPPITPTDVDLQSNVSAGNNLLGTSVTVRGSTLSLAVEHLSDAFVRGPDWAGFQEHFNIGKGAFLAWRPTKYPQDIWYFWRDGAAIRPVNSGPKAYMSAPLSARVHEAEA